MCYYNLISVARQVWTYWVVKQATLLFNSTATATRKAKKQYWIGWIIKTKNLHVHHAFLYISLPVLYDSDVNISENMTSLIYGGRAWTQDNDFLFLFVNLDMVLWNLTPGKNRRHLANWTRYKSSNEVWQSFKFRLRCGRRRCCLNSLINVRKKWDARAELFAH